jgi:integrase
VIPREPARTTSATSAAAGRSGLLHKLLGAVRPEFRVDVLVVDPDDPVLRIPGCLVPGCDRSAWHRGLCTGHGRRWESRGRPELAVFFADPGSLSPLPGRSEPGGCTVTGCHYGTSGRGLCGRHRNRWTRAGQPDPVAWAAAAAPVVNAAARPACALPWCTLWTEHERTIYCRCHANRWRQRGRPSVEQFVAHGQLRGRAHIDFRGLGSQLRLELQYAVQCRHDTQTITLRPKVVTWAITQAIEAGVGSLLALSEAQWRARFGDRRSIYEAFLIYARETVEALHDGTGWEVEYPRDVWRLHTLPGLTLGAGRTVGARRQLDFTRVRPWLRPLAKRFIRLRLTSGLAIGTVVADVGALTRFSEFLTAAAPEVETLAGIDRPLLERYLAWVSDRPGGHSAKEDWVWRPQAFFQTVRQHGWDDTLPTTATFFPGDTPPRPPRMTRHLSEHVMAQVEAPANLDRWPHPEGRLITLILIRCGLRASDACTLAFDCLLHDGQDAPYLHYLNHKMKRQAAVPIDDELEAEIRAQQHRVTERWPDGCPHLFPKPTGNPQGRRPLTYCSYRLMLGRWLRACDVRDEHDRPVQLTPHQWRHTFATRLINRDVPQEVVRVLLDHESTQMTAHYARITDQTVRRRWEQATKVNIKGERISIDPDGPLAQAQWAKTRYGIATQTLPHGYCGLPVQKSCPHANACLTCPVFLTGPEFLPELREHRGRTLTLIDTATAAGQTRVAQMNTQVLANLDRMIGELDTTPSAAAADAR